MKSLRANQHFLFLQSIANVDKTARFTAGFVYNLKDLTGDEIQQLYMQISCFVQELSLL